MVQTLVSGALDHIFSHGWLILSHFQVCMFFFLIYYDNSDPGQVAEEFLAVAHAMAHCVNLFCNVEKLLRVGFLLQKEQVAENGELEELEAEHKSCKKGLASLGKSKELAQIT
ncbi:hypothetical protein BDR06DRAFT_966963 [Suillus hirtellus]|nr:hypothetical protein BDR06DRAFT_966963 [Suillus hirtellus]